MVNNPPNNELEDYVEVLPTQQVESRSILL